MKQCLMNGFLLSLLFIISACTSSPPADNHGVAPQSVKNHLELSFEDLAAVGHYLQSATENQGMTCSLPPNHLPAMMTVYRALVDERYSEEQEVYLKKPLKEKVKYWNRSCGATCSCDVYIGFSEYLQSFNFLLSATEKAAIEKLQEKQKIESTVRAQCIAQAPWVCQSRVLKSIRQKVEK